MYQATQIDESRGDGFAELLAGAAQAPCRRGECTPIACTSGAVLYYQGDPADHFFEVVQGIVKLYMLTPDGRRQVTSFCFPGQFIGHGSEEDYLQTAEAVGDTVLRRYPRARMDRLLAEKSFLRVWRSTRS